MEYKNDVIDAVDFMKPSFGTEKHQEIQRELAEVYRKAEAFDEIEEAYDNTETTRISKYFEAVKVINNFYKGDESEEVSQ